MTQKIAASYPNKTFINIGDRERDFYELLREYESKKRDNAHLLVRAKSNRNIEDTEGNRSKLWDELEKEKIICHLEFEMSSIRRHKNEKKLRKGRVVQQSIKVKRIHLRPPEKVKQFKTFKPIELTAILCSEINPPNEEEKIEWLLLTTLSPVDATEVQKIIKYYVLRWNIELFF